MFYKIHYSFKTATANRKCFDTSLGVKASTPEEALANWAKYTTGFVLANLSNIEVLVPLNDSNGYSNGKYKALTDLNTLAMIEKFIKHYSKATV